MVDPVIPLHANLVPGRYGGDGDTAVQIGTRRINSLWQIAGWSDFEHAAQPLLVACGLVGPGQYDETQQGPDVTAWRIAPDKILLEGPPDLTDFASDSLVVLDLSHARTVITLNGAEARTLLSQVVSVDVSPAALPVGSFLQTGLHGVGVLLQARSQNGIEIFVPTTWAQTILDILCQNAMPLGYEIMSPQTIHAAT